LNLVLLVLLINFLNLASRSYSLLVKIIGKTGDLT
jgi:hypothetical protein